MKIRLYRPDNTFYDRESVNKFIERINNIINESSPEIGMTELENFKDKIILNKYYDTKDIWFLESLEEKINKENKDDLPF